MMDTSCTRLFLNIKCILFGLLFYTPFLAHAQFNQRIEIPEIQLLEKKKNRLEIAYQLVNTGNLDVKLGQASPKIVEVIYTKDTLFGADFDWEGFITSILSEKRVLKVGESIKRTISWKQNTSRISKPDCADLVIRDVQIVRENKSFVWLEYTLENVGTKSAFLLGKDTLNHEDNIVVKCSVSAISKPDRAEWNITESVLGKSFGYLNGTIQPQQKIKELVKVHLDGITKFTPYIIFSIDPFSMLEECDRKNNYFSFKLTLDEK